ncbi:MAG: hypothetical protein IH600_04825 [Bacteroidetes bacterium]|nr:hypothetical protein [Bacteroidota bacterium]
MSTGKKYPLFLRILLRPSALALAALYAAAGLGCAFVPLLHTLGYESALVFGLLAAWIGALLPLSMRHAFQRLSRFGTGPLPAATAENENGRGKAPGPLRVTAARWLHLTLAGMTLLLLPATILTANALLVRNCSMFDGALFWLLIPMATVGFSTAVVLFLDALLGRRAVWAYYAVLLLLLFQPFVQIYTLPQLYAYNHVFGMFLGLSWDQSQPPFLTLLLYRLSTASYVALLLTVIAVLEARRKGVLFGMHRRRMLLAFLPPLAAVLLFHFFSTQLGFTNSYAHLQRVLNAEYRLDNIRVVYDGATMDSSAARRIAEEHLFQLERVCAELGVDWKREITSYIYPDRASKRRLLGTESSDLARPWRAEVHLSADSWAETVKHELVHVVAGSFGPYLNRAPFIRVLGLTEGLAMAVEWSWGNRTLHAFSAGMLAQGVLPHARTCMGTVGFATNSSSSGYVASGSLTRWLMDSLGVAAIRRAYAADNLESTTGMNYEEINRRWRIFLGSVRRDLPDSLAVAYAFRRPSLFSAVCPRVLTERNRSAAEAMAAGKPRRALVLYRAAEALAPNARSAFGIVGALYALERWDSVAVVTSQYLDDTTRAFSLFPMKLWEGAAAWRRGDSAVADRALTRLVEENLPGWPTPFAARMRRALRRGGRDALGVLLTGLLKADARDQDSLRRTQLTALLGKFPRDAVVVEEYMRAATDDSSGRAEALRAWREIESQPANDAVRMLAVRLYYADRQWEEAQRLLRHLWNEALGDAARNEVAEWLARCAWQLRRTRQ